jgi:nucleoside-diphosphate-sugar epimerase
MITVLGASGFIGSHLVEYLRRSGLEFQAVTRGATLPAGALGHVIYCIGVTADFRQRPYDAVDAHVCTLLDFVRNASFDSLLYLSSTRMYVGRSGVAHEDDDVSVNPLRFDDLYGISKVMGESIVLALGAKGRVARPSNVYGRNQAATFLTFILDEARQGSIVFRSPADAVRDYVDADDAAEVLVKIAMSGKERIYNLASGVSISNGELANAIARHSGCRVTFAPGAAPAVFPRIDNERIRSEFGFTTKPVIDAIPSLLGSRA